MAYIVQCVGRDRTVTNLGLDNELDLSTFWDTVLSRPELHWAIQDADLVRIITDNGRITVKHPTKETPFTEGLGV